MDTSVHHDLQTTDKARNLSGFAITYDAMGNPISSLVQLSLGTANSSPVIPRAELMLPMPTTRMG